jgi:hypothetical protein
VEPTSSTIWNQGQSSPAPKMVREQRQSQPDPFQNLSVRLKPSEDSQASCLEHVIVKGKRDIVTLSEASVFSNISESSMNLDDYIYEEFPPPYQPPPPKKLKVVQPTHDKNSHIENSPPVSDVAVKQNPFSQAMGKIQSNLSTVNAFESSVPITSSILSLLEDDTETW